MHLRFHTLMAYRLQKLITLGQIWSSRDVPLNEEDDKGLEPSQRQDTVTVGIEQTLTLKRTCTWWFVHYV